MYLHELHCIDIWKLLINDSLVLANHIEKSHFRSGCWNLHKLLKWQTISVTLIERFFSEESIILEFRKGKENDIKKQANKNLSDSCNLWWSLNPKVAKGEKKIIRMVLWWRERRVVSAHALEHRVILTEGSAVGEYH